MRIKKWTFVGLWLFSSLMAACRWKEGDSINDKTDTSLQRAITFDTVGKVKWLPSASDWRSLVRNESGRALVERKEALDSLLSAVKGDSLAFAAAMQLVETPLAHPNSPYRNDELYAEVLGAKLKSRWYTDLEKSVFRDRLALALQNRVGEPANDFSYWLADGGRQTLYSLKSPFVLLYFYNPECEACKEMKKALLGSEYLMNAVKAGRLALLSVYTDKDLALWRKHLGEYPKEWIMGRDSNEFIYTNGVYDVRAIPSMYLLDANKKVLLKDAGAVEELEAKLKEKS